MLGAPGVLPLRDPRSWLEVRDGDPRAWRLFQRHYSFNAVKRRGLVNRRRMIGPGEKLLLVSPAADAVFCWRWSRLRADGQEGVECSVFRNEGPRLSSALILDAEELGWRRWPGCRFFTFVDPARVRSSNPGYCFRMAGWRRCGVSRARGFVILEKRPDPGGGA